MEMEKMVFSRIPSCRWEFIQRKAKSLKKYNVHVSLADIYMDAEQELISFEMTFPRSLMPGNWKFLGIKIAMEKSFLVFGNVPKTFWNDDFSCNHCHSDRFRKSVIIIQNNDNGQVLQVGKTCVKKFLGSTLAQFGNLLLTIDELAEGLFENDFVDYGIRDNYYNVHKFLLCAYQDIVERGYIKYDSEDGKVKRTLTTTKNKYADCGELTQEQNLLVNDCIKAYADFVSKKGKSDFSKNVMALLGENYIEKKYANMIVFIPTFLINQKKFEAEKRAREEKRKEENSKIKNEYVGAVRDKLSLSVQLIHFSCWESVYGIQYNYTFINDTGSLIQWKTAKNLEEVVFGEIKKGIDAIKGTNITINGTVKEHKEYKGRYYTVLTRCKVSK